MESKRTNSFHQYKNNTYQEDLFGDRTNVRRGEEEVFVSSFDFTELIRRISQIVSRLLIALKYQVFKHSQGLTKDKNWKLPINMSWFKMAFLALAVFILFKKDLSFSVNMRSPEGIIADKNDAHSVEKNRLNGFAQTAAYKEEKKLSPFADFREDNAETKVVKSYIRRFKDLAQDDYQKFGVLASIKMAQAIIESNAGRSQLSKKNNNHFGIKCFSKNCKKGHCSNFNDDHHKDFFRKYPNAWESWRAHSQFIINNRYKSLLSFGKDYRAWAKGLKDLGYATDKNYPKRLIKTIERYQLHLLDI